MKPMGAIFMKMAVLLKENALRVNFFRSTQRSTLRSNFIYTKIFARPGSNFIYTKIFGRPRSNFIYTKWCTGFCIDAFRSHAAALGSSLRPVFLRRAWKMRARRNGYASRPGSNFIYTKIFGRPRSNFIYTKNS